jgi:hypothetical protein
MSGSLILLPLRLGTRAVELSLRGATEVLERLAGLAGVRSSPEAPPSAPTDTQPAGQPPGEPAGEPADEAAPERADEPAREPADEPDSQPADDEPLIDRGEPVDYDSPTPVEPEHVDTGEVLVETVAEEGAQDGAGAQIRIAEPWDGYRELRAADVVARARTATPEELAAVELFELAGRKRQTVISAVQRELKRRS